MTARVRTGRALIDDCWLDGTILPGFCDSHVHLGLVDAAELVPHGIARVLDLGWDPEIARHWPSLARSGGLAVDITGSILTARGGYPGSSDWAPPAAAREIHTPADAESAIADIRSIGGRVAKIALNSDAGPVWPDDLLEVVVSIAHRSGLPVVAHPGDAVIGSLGGMLPPLEQGRTVSFIPGPAYDNSTNLVDWLCTSVVIAVAHLEEIPT